MDVSQYLEIFIDETSEHLQNLSDCIMELEKDPENMDTRSRKKKRHRHRPRAEMIKSILSSVSASPRRIKSSRRKRAAHTFMA